MALNLVYDRTENDVQYLNEILRKIRSSGVESLTTDEYDLWFGASAKGRYNYTDLNRVEECTIAIRDFLYSAGYNAVITEKNSAWASSEYLTYEQLMRIHANINSLRTAFYSVPDWSDLVDKSNLNYEDANAIEWDLNQLYNYYSALLKALELKRSGTNFMVAGGILNAR